MRRSATLATVAASIVAMAAACSPSRPPADAGADGGLSRAEPPPPLEARDIAFPAFHEATLPNGLDVLVVPYGTQPVANVSLYVRAGSATDPPARAGRAELAADLLTKGTASRSAVEISETIENAGGTLSATAASDWVTVSATVLADDLSLAFDLLSDVTLRPTFPDEEVALSRTRWLSSLEAELGESSAIAERRFLRDVYGPEHPYGRKADPTTVAAIERSDLVAFRDRYFAPGHALLVVSGRVTPERIEALAREHFGAWDGAAPAPDAFPEPARLDQTRISLVDRPGAVQSTIYAGHLAMRPGDPDFFPMVVLNQVLGGGSDSRLFRILREEKGWSYGAYSGMTRPMDVGYFMAEAEVRTEVTGPALAEMLQQLRRIRDEAVADDEFAAARSYLHGSFPLRLETPAGVAGQVARNRLLGLPRDQLTEYRAWIAAVTPADVQRAARTHIRPDQTAIVVVGDAARIRRELDAIAAVTVHRP